MSSPRLILASASPRRQSLLAEAGYRFVVQPANVDEDGYPENMLPADVARHLAFVKADTIATRFGNDVILGADTVVAFGDKMLGQPEDADDARRILTLLGGTTHVVITGLAVICRATQFVRTTRVMSAVRMRAMAAQELDDYVASGQWAGKAGAYGIQDEDPFVTRISGCHTNIVGLPMKATRGLLAAAGVEPGAEETRITEPESRMNDE
jgi:septum formation protein